MLERLLSISRAAGLDPSLDTLGDGHLVTFSRGARAVPFDEQGQPLLWLSPALLKARTASDLAAWAASGDWNFGAERLWIGPEIEYMVSDPHDFAGSYVLPAAMDPGDWSRVAEPPGETSLRTFRREMQLFAHGQRSPLAIDVEQRLRPARDLMAGPTGVRHVGWAREVTVRRAAEDPGTAVCHAWVIAQVTADQHALAIVPGAASARVTDYFEPIDAQHFERSGPDLILRLTGTTRYKVGVKSGQHRGQLAYWRDLPDGQSLLLLRTFADDPSSRYLERPPASPQHEGDSIFVYNDNGRLGDFGEIEAFGRALERGQAEVADRFELHAWWGAREALEDAARSVGIVS